MNRSSLKKLVFFIYAGTFLSACENIETAIQQHAPNESSQSGGQDLTGLSALSVMNFDQIYQTYASLTGVNNTIPPNSTTVQNYYLQNKGSLPQNNDPSVLSAANMNAITNLAAQFCQALIDNGTLRAAFFGSSPYAQLTQRNRNTLFGSEELRVQYVDFLIQKFWDSQIDSLPERAPAREQMIQLMRDLFDSSPANGNTNAEARALGMAGCAATLASAEVILF